jgi:hypothetical protein
VNFRNYVILPFFEKKSMNIIENNQQLLDSTKIPGRRDAPKWSPLQNAGTGKSDE